MCGRADQTWSGSTPWGGRGRCSELLRVTSLLPQSQEAAPPPVPLCTVPSLYFPSSGLLRKKPSLPRSSSSSCLTPHPSTARSPRSYLHSPRALPVTLLPSMPPSAIAVSLSTVTMNPCPSPHTHHTLFHLALRSAPPNGPHGVKSTFLRTDQAAFRSPPLSEPTLAAPGRSARPQPRTLRGSPPRARPTQTQPLAPNPLWVLHPHAGLDLQPCHRSRDRGTPYPLPLLQPPSQQAAP